MGCNVNEHNEQVLDITLLVSSYLDQKLYYANPSVSLIPPEFYTQPSCPSFSTTDITQISNDIGIDVLATG